jgi:hypothetical protein
MDSPAHDDEPEEPASACPHGNQLPNCLACVTPRVRVVVFDDSTGRLFIDGKLQPRGFMPEAPSSRFGEKLAARRKRKAAADADDGDDAE